MKEVVLMIIIYYLGFVFNIVINLFAMLKARKNNHKIFLWVLVISFGANIIYLHSLLVSMIPIVYLICLGFIFFYKERRKKKDKPLLTENTSNS